MRARRMFALVAILAAGALSSCVPPPTGGPTTSATPSATASATPSAPDGTPAITIASPGEGETVSVPFTVNGEANTFEATLTIDAQDASGMTMCVRLLTATSGSGTPGTWQGMLAFPPEEDPLPVTLRAYTYSPKDGSMVDLVEYPITVSSERPDIILTSPTCGQVYRVGGLMMITGTAALFEAAFIVELRDAAGTPVLSLPMTAEECCVESLFSSSLTIPADLAPGWYDFAAYSESAKDGSVENEFIVQIEVRG